MDAYSSAAHTHVSFQLSVKTSLYKAVSSTWRMLSTISPPAAAGSRPVTRPTPFAADHLHQSLQLVELTLYV